MSSHHACVFRDGHSFVLEDLQSTNGRSVQHKWIGRCQSKQDDVIVVGDRQLTFSERSDGPVASAAETIEDGIAGETMFDRMPTSVSG